MKNRELKKIIKEVIDDENNDLEYYDDPDYGWDNGYKAGHYDGYKAGYDDGYKDGQSDIKMEKNNRMG